MRCYLGVDGGGTKTNLLLIDDTGRVLASGHVAESAYHLEIGLEGLRDMLVREIREILRQASLVAGDVTHAFLGLPAYGENEALRPDLDRIATPVIPAERCSCDNDVVCAWAGALGGDEGIVVVAGTGSIAYGELGGRRARAGGWGELLGDEGSAYWIAREALTVFTRMSDGRLPRSALYHLLRERFRLTSDLDMPAAVQGPPALSRRELAGLAPLVTQSARTGDEAALDILRRGSRELVDLVRAVRVMLRAPPAARPFVSCVGGLFRCGSLLLPLFTSTLADADPSYEFTPPRLDPAAGAALEAAKRSGEPLDRAAIESLEHTHRAASAHGART